MQLKITTRDKAFTDDMLQSNREIRLPRDILVEFKGIEFKKRLDAPEIAAFLISVGAHIPAALAADIITAWIVGSVIDRLKRSASMKSK
jgi:hypothetical protein